MAASAGARALRAAARGWLSGRPGFRVSTGYSSAEGWFWVVVRRGVQECRLARFEDVDLIDAADVGFTVEGLLAIMDAAAVEMEMGQWAPGDGADEMTRLWEGVAT